MCELVDKLAEVATNPAEEVAECLCRDAFNRALRNPDNHLRNNSVQRLPDGTVQLTPLYDIGPMYMDPELITRTCHWRGEDQRVVDAWPEIIERLDMDAAMRQIGRASCRERGCTYV